ncbi:MAG: transketolase [Candidatus Falkowbacteria bacterium]|nr:transketolase [Candidatus Falkowbacteria bacterium]
MELYNLKKKIIKICTNAKEGHIPSALSILDIVWVLYDKVLKINPKNSKDPNRDYFILSKGHASLALYVVLAEKGFFNSNELENFGKFNSILGGHPSRNKVPGVEASTGSLGHGLPIAVGLALGLKIKKKDNRVFAIVGDGESNEGTIWESAFLASHHELSNLCCVIDHNHSTDRALSVGDLVLKFKSFGWNALVIDGHNQEEILKALSVRSKDKPLAIIAETIKGKGFKMMENNPAWHHKFPNEEELKLLLEE